MSYWHMEFKRYWEVHLLRKEIKFGFGYLFQKGFKAVHVGPVIILLKFGKRGRMVGKNGEGR